MSKKTKKHTAAGCVACVRPRRSDYPNEPRYLAACIEHLDHLFPDRIDRQRQWHLLELESDTQRLRDRLVALIQQDGELSAYQAEEFDYLAAAWRAHRSLTRITKTKE